MDRKRLTYLLVFVHIVLLFIAFRQEPSTNGDNAKYIILGESICQGRYCNIAAPDCPKETQYPPVFPAMLSIAHGEVVTAKLIVMVCSVISLLLWIMQTGNWWVWLLTACSALLVEFGVIAMSEVPYLMFTLLAVWLLKKDDKKLWWLAVIASVLPIGCRTIGISFSLTWICYTLIKRKYRYTIGHIALLIPFLALFRGTPYWMIVLQKNAYAPTVGFMTFKELLARVLQNATYYSSNFIPATIIPNVNLLAIGIIVTLVIIYGAILSREWFWMLYIVIYFGALLTWQEQWSGTRFLVPIMPMLCLFAFKGLRTMGPGAFAIIVLLNIAAIINQPRKLTPDWIRYYECAEWIKKNTPENAVVTSRKPELFYLKSGRAGNVYAYSNFPEVVINSIGDYLIIDAFRWTNTTPKYLHPAIKGNLDRFEVMHVTEAPKTAILKRRY